jgi:hypothetical protein
MVLLFAFDIMKKARDDGRSEEGFNIRLIQVQGLCLDQHDGPCVAGNGLAVAETMGALQLGFIEKGATFPDKLVASEGLFSAPDM